MVMCGMISQQRFGSSDLPVPSANAKEAPPNIPTRPVAVPFRSPLLSMLPQASSQPWNRPSTLWSHSLPHILTEGTSREQCALTHRYVLRYVILWRRDETMSRRVLLPTRIEEQINANSPPCPFVLPSQLQIIMHIGISNCVTREAPQRSNVSWLPGR
jgi:hypothetical protein